MIVVLDAVCPVCGLEYFALIERSEHNLGMEAEYEQARDRLAGERPGHGHRFAVVR